MLRPQGFLIDADGTREHRFHFTLAALRVVQQCQALETHSEIRMVRTAEFLVDRDRAPDQPFGLLESALHAIELGQPRKAGRQAHVRFTEAFRFFQRKLELTGGFVRIAPVVGCGSRVEKTGPCRFVRGTHLRRSGQQSRSQQGRHQACRRGPGSHACDSNSGPRGPGQAFTRLRYSPVRVSISIMSPVPQKSGTLIW